MTAATPFEMLAQYPDPRAINPATGRPVAFSILEWAVKNVSDMETAKEFRTYLAQWEDGPQFSMLSVEVASSILDYTRQAILHNIKTGRIKAVWFGRSWMIPFSEIEGFEIRVGRPKKQNAA